MVVIMREKQIWDDWATYNEDGYVNGVKDNAPDDVKKAYEQYLHEKEELNKRGIKI